jgi:hypothetical protein
MLFVLKEFDGKTNSNDKGVSQSKKLDPIILTAEPRTSDLEARRSLPT